MIPDWQFTFSIDEDTYRYGTCNGDHKQTQHLISELERDKIILKHRNRVLSTRPIFYVRTLPVSAAVTSFIPKNILWIQFFSLSPLGSYAQDSLCIFGRCLHYTFLNY